MKILALVLSLLLSCNFAVADPLRGAMVRKALVNGALNNQSIPNNMYNPYAKLIVDQVIYDTENCFDPLDSSFIVPVGVSYAIIAVQVTWGNSTAGNRQLVILRKSPLNVNPNAYEFFTGDPVATQVANDQTDQSARTPVAIPVIAGERYAAFPYQTSGGNLVIMGGTGTIFGITFF